MSALAASIWQTLKREGDCLRLALMLQRAAFYVAPPRHSAGHTRHAAARHGVA